MAAAAWLLGTWGDKSLLPLCGKVWKGDIKGDVQEDAKRACAFYAIGHGDLSNKAEIAEFGGDSTMGVLLRALVGDKSKMADWQREAAPLKKQPDNGRAIVYNAALAILGDKAATAAATAGIKSCKAPVIRETAKVVMVAQTSRWAAGVRKDLAGCLGKLGDSDMEGRALAQASYALLRAGDASALPAMAKALGSADQDVVGEAADLLSGQWGSVGVHGHSKGLAGGVPVKGVGKLLRAALEAHKDTSHRANLLTAWAMQRAAGGD